MSRDEIIAIICAECCGRMGGMCFGAGGGCESSGAIADGIMSELAKWLQE